MKNPIHLFEDTLTQTLIALELTKTCTPLIDERMMTMAERATSRPDSFFQALGRDALEIGKRPDSINHAMTLLAPNAYSTSEVDERIGYLDFLFPGEVEMLAGKFNDFADDNNLFERLRSTPDKRGETFVHVWDHSELANLGYAAGGSHLSAREHGIDRLEDHLAVVVGRLVGYFEFNGENVMDGILRKVGSVIKTFPKGGSEALDENEMRDLELFRKLANHRTKQAFGELLESRDGKLIHMAPSGEEDKLDKETGITSMRTFGKGTCDLLIEASQSGVTIIPGCFDRHAGGSVIEFADPVPAGELQNVEDCHEIGRIIAASGTLAKGAASAEHPDDLWYKSPVVYRSIES